MTEALLAIVLLTALTLLLVLAVLGSRAVLMPARPAVLTVNGETRVNVRTGERLLGALHGADILVPSACAGAGTCGLCRVKITEGGAPVLPTEAARLTRADQRAGMHLACQVVLRGDMAVEVDEALIGAESYTATVVSACYLTPQIREVVLQLPETHRPQITAGSFVQVTAPPFGVAYADIAVPPDYVTAWQPYRQLRVQTPVPVTRAYSISNTPEDSAAGRVVLNVRIALPPPSVPDAPPGVVSSWLFAVSEGEPMELSGPFGSVKVQDTEAEMVFIGGGVGMAPLRAMIHEELRVKTTRRKMSFWYGARTRAEMLYTNEFDALAAAHDNFDWTVVLSDAQPADNWTGATGFVHSVVLRDYLAEHPAPETCEFYLCGPPLMIRAVLSMLDELGVDPDHIFNDDFGV